VTQLTGSTIKNRPCQNTRKVLLTSLFFALGELLGVPGFLWRMHAYGLQLRFALPVKFGDVTAYGFLILGVVIVPAFIAKLGNRLVDAYFN
jgi:hypothetical protein